VADAGDGKAEVVSDLARQANDGQGRQPALHDHHGLAVRAVAVEQRGIAEDGDGPFHGVRL
jgi:hypothetical protein